MAVDGKMAAQNMNLGWEHRYVCPDGGDCMELAVGRHGKVP